MNQKAKLFAFSTLLSLLTAASCTQDSAVSDSVDAQIQVNLTSQDTWTPVSILQTRADTDPYCALYLFDPSGKKILAWGGAFDRNSSTAITQSFSQIISEGTHTVYGITDWQHGVLTQNGSITPTTAVPLTLTDLHVGSASFTVESSLKTYNVTVSASPIMSKLALKITGVPAKITSVTATLPAQATSFTLKGDVSGNTNSQTLNFTTDKTQAADGSLTWTVAETLVYPFADATTGSTATRTMPITIVCSDGTSSTTFSTTSTVLCTKGTRVSLTAPYSAFTANATLTESAWTGTVTDGSLDLGFGTTTTTEN